MNLTAPNAALLQRVWLETFWNYMNACIQSGKEYLPHEQNNIAHMAACLADSVNQAFIERFSEIVPQSGGSVAPQSSMGDEFYDAIKAPGPRPPVGQAIDQALAQFQDASKPASQFKPASRGPRQG